MYYLSTGDQGINIYYKMAVFMLRSNQWKRWDVPLSQLETNRWYFLEYTWHHSQCSEFMSIIDWLEPIEPTDVPYRTWNSANNHFYIGRANDGSPHGENFKYGEFTIDHHLIWGDTRENLIANGHIVRGMSIIMA